MKTEYVKATRKQLIGSLKESNISRRIDKMDLYREYKFYLMDDAKKAAKAANYKRALSFVHCKVYVTNKQGVYGYQFLAVLRIVADGKWYEASGTLTGGCGYDKISTAIDSAVRYIGLNHDLVKSFGGVGNHDQVLSELAGKLAGRKAWFQG
jgi:hypothetical protein